MNLTENIDNLLKFLKKNHKLILISIILLAAGIKLYYFSLTYDQPLWWDEADYMSYAKSMGKNLDINNIWYYRRTVFLPVFWAGLFRLGLDETAIRFTEIIFGIGFIFFGYLIGKEMFNKIVGLIVATGLAFSRLILFLGTRFMNSLPATLFFLMGLWFFWKGYVKKQHYIYIWLSALFFVTAISIRFSLLLSLICIGAYVFFKEKGKFWKNKHVLIGILIIFLVLMPYFIGYAQHYEGGVLNFLSHYTSIGRKESQEQTIYIAPLEGMLGNIRSMWLNLGKILSIFILVGGAILFSNLLCIDKIFKDKKVRKSFFILIWMLPPFLFHSLYTAGSIGERYMLWIYPALLMLMGLGIVKIYHYAKKSNKVLGYLFIGLVLILICLNIFSQIKMGDELIKNKINSYGQVKDAGIWMKENSKLGDIMISNSVPQIQYYSERSTYMASNASHLESLNPKFIMLSIFEGREKAWFFKYPVEKNLKVVQAYFLDREQTKPSVVIYQY